MLFDRMHIDLCSARTEVVGSKITDYVAVKTGMFIVRGKRARDGRGSETSFSLYEITG